MRSLIGNELLLPIFQIGTLIYMYLCSFNINSWSEVGQLDSLENRQRKRGDSGREDRSCSFSRMARSGEFGKTKKVWHLPEMARQRRNGVTELALGSLTWQIATIRSKYCPNKGSGFKPSASTYIEDPRDKQLHSKSFIDDKDGFVLVRRRCIRHFHQPT